MAPLHAYSGGGGFDSDRWEKIEGLLLGGGLFGGSNNMACPGARALTVLHSLAGRNEESEGEHC